MTSLRYSSAVALIALLLTGCVLEDDNAKPEYGPTGLAANCRAYVQEAVDGYRSKQYTADEAMNGIERNCGAAGQSWKNMRR